MADPRTPIACDLDALTAAERERRASLARGLVAKARSVRELSDGYALELDPADDLARASLDWLLLERRCCRFFHLELALEPDGGALWVGLRGGPGVKELLASSGLAAAARGGV
jgi:hypothetical protein